MTRFLLTLLALLTGLSAAGGSVEARVCGLGGAQVGAHEAMAGEGQVTARKQRAIAPRARHDRAERMRGCGTSQPFSVAVPTVLFGPDRAFE